MLQVKLRGAHDDFIMNQERLSRYSVSQQRDINLVRIYLQCTTLADLCDCSDTKSIARSSYEGERSLSFSMGVGWPRQKRPSAAQRRLWRRYVSSNFLRYGNLWKRSPIPTLRELKRRYDKERSAIEERNLDLPSQIEALPIY